MDGRRDSWINERRDCGIDEPRNSGLHDCLPEWRPVLGVCLGFALISSTPSPLVYMYPARARL